MIRGCQILFLSWLVSLSDRGLITFVLNCFVTLPWLTLLYYVLILSVVDFLTSKKVHKVKVRAIIWKKDLANFQNDSLLFSTFSLWNMWSFRGKSNQEFFCLNFKKGDISFCDILLQYFPFFSPSLWHIQERG